MFDIISKAKIWVTGWILLIVVWVILFVINMNLSIAFTWGMEIVIDTQSNKEDLKKDFEMLIDSAWYKDYEVMIWTKDKFMDILLKIKFSDDNSVSQFSLAVTNMLVDKWYVKDAKYIIETSIIWPSIWDYMKQTAIKAIIFSIIGICIYILFAFSEIREYLSPLGLSMITILTLLFDVVVSAWAYGIFMAINPAVQIDVIFIIAILTIMGYSINDTIIIFDRIRENFKIYEDKIRSWKMTYKEIFESSLWQTMRRSLWTSISTLLVVISMFIFGTWVMKLFAFTIWVWIIVWTYSSIFLAAPLGYLISGKK